MNDFNRTVGMADDRDVGLRSFLTGTYKYMAMAMAVSAAVAYFLGGFLAENIQYMRIFSSPFAFLALVVGIPVAFGLVGRSIGTMSLTTARIFLFGFAAVMGAWLAPIALIGMLKTGADIMIFKVFFMAVAAFASVSLYGYVTKRDLSGVAKIAVMVFIGGVAYFLISAFIPSLRAEGLLDIGINMAMLIAISLITAWETQTLKRTYYATVGNPELAEKYSVVGAASLLLSFINIFILLFNLIGSD